MNAVSRTVPNSATRPTSLRPRSTSIRCSARSFGSAVELRGEGRVLLRRGAPRAGAGDRPERDLAVLHPDEDLGRASDDVNVVAVQIVQVRRRIERPEVAVGEKRIRRRHLEPAGEHGLKGVAGGDVLLDPAHVVLEPLVGVGRDGAAEAAAARSRPAARRARLGQTRRASRRSVASAAPYSRRSSARPRRPAPRRSR